MKMVRRALALGMALFAAAAAPALAQERTAVKAGFTLPANSGKKILLFRPKVSTGAQSTGGLFEPNADWTDKARKNIDGALRKRQAISAIRSSWPRKPSEATPASPKNIPTSSSPFPRRW